MSLDIFIAEYDKYEINVSASTVLSFVKGLFASVNIFTVSIISLEWVSNRIQPACNTSQNTKKNQLLAFYQSAGNLHEVVLRQKELLKK